VGKVARVLPKLALAAVLALGACGNSGDGGPGTGGSSNAGGTGFGGAKDGGGAVGGSGGSGATVGGGGSGGLGGTAGAISGGSGGSDAGDASAGADAGDGDASSVSSAQACGDWANAYCSLLSQCEPFHVTLWFGDLPTCQARMALPCLATLGDSGTTWNGSSMEACAQAVENEACSTWYSHALLTECVPPPGAASDSAPCRDDGQCQSSHCLVPNDSLDGTCAPAPAPGSAQCYDDDDCATGWLCKNATYDNPGQCLEVVAGGGVCLSKVCAKNYDCIPDPCTICPPQPTCKAGLGIWSTCQNSYAGQCDDLQGLICKSSGQTSYVCLPEDVAQVGDACTGVCAANATCTSQPDGGSICVAVPDGGSCDGNSGPFCAPPAKCVAGTCQI
jgi:hypothetical protein